MLQVAAASATLTPTQESTIGDGAPVPDVVPTQKPTSPVSAMPASDIVALDPLSSPLTGPAMASPVAAPMDSTSQDVMEMGMFVPPPPMVPFGGKVYFFSHSFLFWAGAWFLCGCWPHIKSSYCMWGKNNCWIQQLFMFGMVLVVFS